MKQLSTLVLMLFAITVVNAQTSTGSFMFEGEMRDYRVFLPNAYSPGSSLPLVFNFHGYGSDAWQQELYSGMNNIADTAGFIVCYPNGLMNSWNVGIPGGSTADDVGFTSVLIDSLHAKYNIDLDRVFSTGMSNGGFFSYKLACELDTRIAAIASVTGSMTTTDFTSCSPTNPTPVLHMHGTADATVNYEGSLGVMAVEDVIDYWVNENNCPTPTDTSLIPDVVAEGSFITTYSYKPGDDNTEVILYKIDSGGHTWPGAFPVPAFGITNQDIDASDVIWLFFRQYTLAGGPTSLGPLNNTNSFSLYPNPANSTLNVDLQGQGQLCIYNTIGSLMLEETLLNSSTIDISGWQPGLYIVQVESEGQLSTQRLIIR